jgi:UDP-N-acetylmuramoyl-tripeptide--D-alanyl-D-alanine ligase
MRQVLEKFLADSAHRLLARERPQVIAVTGSVGKSSTKQATLAVLGAKFAVRGTPGNFNTEIGLPLTVLGLPGGGSSCFVWFRIAAAACLRSVFGSRNYPRLLVLEMAADKPGDIARLCAIARPDVAVVTTVGESHLEAFKTVAAIEKEKGMAIEALGPDGVAVLNRDDERVWKMRPRTKAAAVGFGFHEEADVRGLEETVAPVLDPGRPGMRFKLQADGSTVPFFLPGVLGTHSIYAALAAVAVGRRLGMNLVEIADGLLRYAPAPGRMRLLPGIKGTFLIDDTYNAAPRSVTAALETLRDIQLAAPDDRKFAVLGDMMELGAESLRMHAEIGAKAVSCADVVVFVGERMAEAEKAARVAGVAEGAVFHFATAGEAGRFVQERMRQGDAVLVKGSRAMEMERTVKELMAEPLRAKELLVKAHADW